MLLSRQQHPFMLANPVTFYDAMTGLVCKGRALDTAYLSFSKASDIVSHYILTEKLMKLG